MCTYPHSDREGALLAREEVIVLIQGPREHILIINYLIHE